MNVGTIHYRSEPEDGLFGGHFHVEHELKILAPKHSRSISRLHMRVKDNRIHSGRAGL